MSRAEQLVGKISGDQIEPEVIKRLTRNTASGRRAHEVFRDLLYFLEDGIDQLPAHVAQLKLDRTLAKDPPDMVERWDKLRAQYNSPFYWQNFTEAAAILINGTSDATGTPEYADRLGNIYMQFAYPNPGSGQYFTPMPVAKLMAMVTCPDLEKDVHVRIQNAIKKSPAAEALLLAHAFAHETTEGMSIITNRVMPLCWEHYEPVRVCDPACGSGVMLLAVASTIPPWMSYLGLVQYYGVDIDPLCCQMARINLKLYGCNGYGLKCALACTDAELTARTYTPEAIARVHEAKEAYARGQDDEFRQLAKTFRENRGQFEMNL